MTTTYLGASQTGWPHMDKVDASGTTKYTYYAGGLVNAEDPPRAVRHFQLADVVIIVRVVAASEDRGYLYDAAWNLNKRTNNGSVYTFSVDSKNQLTSAPLGSCTYDGNGNLTAYGLTGYAYDAENQLTNAAWIASDALSGQRSDFAYDGRGRLRVRVDYTWQNTGGTNGIWSPGGEVHYVYDGMRVIQERSSANTPQVSYTRGNDLSGSFEGAGGIGGLLSRSHAYQSGSGSFTNHNFYHADGNGNITYMVNGSQSMVASYRYDPYGNPMGQSGTLWTANVYRFSSKEYMATAGNYYYGYRFYDPFLQRWLNRDPIDEVGFSIRRFSAGRRQTYGAWNSNTWGILKRLRKPNSPMFTFVMNNPVSNHDARGLRAGCDYFPDASETPCVLECCAEHDACWAENDCGFCSWLPFRLPFTRCGWCNLEVVACITACALVDDGF